jgi:hypothetical protein
LEANELQIGEDLATLIDQSVEVVEPGAGTNEPEIEAIGGLVVPEVSRTAKNRWLVRLRRHGTGAPLNQDHGDIRTASTRGGDGAVVSAAARRGIGDPADEGYGTHGDGSSGVCPVHNRTLEVHPRRNQEGPGRILPSVNWREPRFARSGTMSARVVVT